MAKKKTGLQIEYHPSEELAEFLGCETDDLVTRAEVTRALWDYIKEQGLQNSKNKRIIEPDGTLSPLIGSRSIDMFQMTKKMSKHFLEV